MSIKLSLKLTFTTWLTMWPTSAHRKCTTISAIQYIFIALKSTGSEVNASGGFQVILQNVSVLKGNQTQLNFNTETSRQSVLFKNKQSVWFLHAVPTAARYINYAFIWSIRYRLPHRFPRNIFRIRISLSARSFPWKFSIPLSANFPRLTVNRTDMFLGSD